MDLCKIRAMELTSVPDNQINWTEYLGPAGKEHYQLLAYLSTQFNNATIFDIGTHRGASALALSFNSTNTVHSFDIAHAYTLPQKSNIVYHLEDLFQSDTRTLWTDRLLQSAFIFLDIDPHEGTREYAFYEWLRDKEYRGFVVCDDIWYFKEMRDNFWFKIPTEHKVDLTALGHWSGTGIVRFIPSDLFPQQTAPSNWTVVTAYFDLTRMPDASASIKGRPREHYLQSARATMSLDQNLVVYCEPDSVDLMKAMRPVWLAHKTKYVTMSFEDFRLTQYRNQIIENRKRFPYAFDDRNTASYYLLCMARYDMLKRTIAENPFQTSHFAWLNICIERMGYKNLVELDAVFRENRDKFSTCYIDYRPRHLVFNPPEYFRYGGLCSMCSGFFTGNAHYMREFCERIEEKFLWYLERGYGHADEQLFSAVYFDHPELFDVYYGDYQQMVTNYVWVKDAAASPLHIFIANSFRHGDWAACKRGCERLWASYKKGYAALSIQDVGHLVDYYRRCCIRLCEPIELP